MPIQFIHKEPAALDKEDDTSNSRELYIDNMRLVSLKFEMDKEEAWDLFNQLPEHILPPLPEGYKWVRTNDK